MKSLVFNDLFLAELHKKIPKRSVLANSISDILDMDKVSVYRRLRKDTKFTTDEVSALADNLNISLDRVRGTSFDREMRVNMLDALKMPYSNITVDPIDNYIDLFKWISREPENEMGAVLHSAPKMMLVPHKNLIRFLIFKWGHSSIGGAAYSDLGKVELSDKYNTLHEQMKESLRHVQKMYYIWDDAIIPNLVKDIKYYESMRMVTASDVKLLKEELMQMLKNLEEDTTKGMFSPHTKFEFYITSFNLEGTVMCVYNANRCLPIINLFDFKEILVYEKDVCLNIKHFIEQIKKGAIMISTTAEKERILFFRRQYDLIHTNL